MLQVLPIHCFGAPSGHCPQVCAARRRPGLLGKPRSSHKAAFRNAAPLRTDLGFLQRLKFCFETLPCLSIGCADLQTLDTMQPMERKRQGYIHELIQTEERYVDDLQLVVEVRVPADGLWALGAEGWEAWRRGVTSDVRVLTLSNAFSARWRGLRSEANFFPD